MTRPNRRPNILILICAFYICACAKVQIRDVALYFDAGDSGAVMTRIISGGDNRIPKEEWDVIRRETVALTYNDFGWVKSTIIKLCSENKKLCEEEKLQSFASRSERILSRLRR